LIGAVSTEVAGAAALLVLRLWFEPGLGMRVRITRTTSANPRDELTSYAASRHDVLEAVAEWLDEASADQPGIESP
jgi:hypothetical protein